MNLRSLSGIALAALLALGAHAQAQEAAGEGTEETVTVITSDRLTFDYKNKYALFESNVVVTDPEMKLTAENLLVTFDDEGDAKTIKAEGKVRISQDDKVAVAKKVTYNVPEGKIIMTGDPKVQRGRDILTGDTITFWRDQDKMICEPRARLVIYPEKGRGKERLLGEY